jgi:hypothetical protein
MIWKSIVLGTAMSAVLFANPPASVLELAGRALLVVLAAIPLDDQAPAAKALRRTARGAAGDAAKAGGAAHRVRRLAHAGRVAAGPAEVGRRGLRFGGEEGDLCSLAGGACRGERREGLGRRDGGGLRSCRSPGRGERHGSGEEKGYRDQ